MFLDSNLIQIVYEWFSYIAIAFLPIGLLYFIINRIFRGLHYKKNIILNLCLGIVLTAIFIISFFVDYEGGKLSYYILYFLLIASSIFYPSVIIITKVCRRRSFSKNGKAAIKYQTKQVLYLVFKYESNIYLQKEKSMYHPLVYDLKKQYFHDEALKEIFEKYNLDPHETSYKKVGETIIDSKETVYSYLITTYEYKTFEDLERVDAFVVVNLPMNEVEKEITMKTILGDQFHMERSKKK